MNRSTSIVASLLLVIAIFFNSGCADTKDGRKTQIQGTAFGAIAGGLLGAALGAATGNRNNIAAFAIAGAALGGRAGYAYGTEVAKRKARYARTEDWLNQEIALARQSNANALAYNARLRQRVTDLNRRVVAAKAAGNKNELRALKGQITLVSNEAAQTNKQETQATNDQKAILGDESARKSANFAAYQRESEKFNQARAERGQLVGRLAGLENSIDR
jgi:uncharacterized protein YcfJ